MASEQLPVLAMDNPSFVADLIRWMLGIPADQVTWRHVVFLIVGGLIWCGPGAFRLWHHHKHIRFIQGATPDQLAAYSGKMPPPKPPSLGGPAVMLAVLLALSLSARREERTASAASPEITTASTVRNCCKECDPPSRCNRCKCEAQTVKPPKVQPQRNERFTSAPVPPLQSWRDEPVLYDERWRRYLPES